MKPLILLVLTVLQVGCQAHPEPKDAADAFEETGSDLYVNRQQRLILEGETFTWRERLFRVDGSVSPNTGIACKENSNITEWRPLSEPTETDSKGRFVVSSKGSEIGRLDVYCTGDGAFPAMYSFYVVKSDAFRGIISGTVVHPDQHPAH